MDWKNLPTGGNIEDRRGGGGLPGGGLAVGGGLGGLLLALIAMFFGVDLGGLTGGGTPTQVPGTQTQGFPLPPTQSQTTPGQRDEAYDLVDRVLASTDQTWSRIFQQSGREYTRPTLVLFNQYVQSGCGQASAATGPFYCPLDSKMYLDTSFFATMDRRLGGGGDFAYSYVIAHEVGHHVQNELGIADQVERRQRAARSEAEANTYGVRLELQADCFAGVWGHSVRGAQFANLTQEDIREAINTAAAIGDDALQRQGQGYVVPDSFTHGSSQQRVSWFLRGFESGNPNQCDTFSQEYSQL